MALDLADRHAARIEAQNFVIETVEPGLPLGDELWLEASGAIARDGNLDLALFGQDRLRARHIAAPRTVLRVRSTGYRTQPHSVATS
jgi:hypothetical protein